MHIVDFILHLDRSLALLAAILGNWLYLLIFLIVFCETGLVVTPFLPGDSLLFGVGALCAREDLSYSVFIFLALVPIAALCGDVVNYSIGYLLRKKFERSRPRWISARHLERTQAFFSKHGSGAVFLSRFMPFFRTFAPFASGLGEMPFRHFFTISTAAAFCWSELFLWVGYLFGGLPWVKKNMSMLILGVIAISLLPAVIQFLRERRTRSVKV